jgi:hypothetical protein
MKHSMLSVVVGLLTLTAVSFPGVARAQYGAPIRTVPQYYSPPVVSPYLSLVQRGTSPAINYYNIVRPDIEFRSGIQGLQQQVNNQAAQDQAAAAGLPFTGHSTVFMNYSHYYGRSSATAGRGTSASGQGRPAASASSQPAGPQTGQTLTAPPALQ